MPSGVVLFPNPRAINVIDDVVAQACRAYALGVLQVWLGQRRDHSRRAGRRGRIGPRRRHVRGADKPALPATRRIAGADAQAASHGNFSLGLGLGAHKPERQTFGMSWPNTITRLREHLTVLRSIFDTGAVDLSANEISAQPGWPVRVAGGTPVPVYVAAMVPKASQFNGGLAD
jgi:hypothetical protein